MTVEALLPVPVKLAEGADPAEFGFPHMLPYELALGEDSPKELCESYGIDKERFKQLCKNPAFQKAFHDAKELLAKEGSFRIKARLQSEALLKTSWKLIHAEHTPAAVKADLIKATYKAANLEPKAGDAGAANNLQININLG